MPYRDHENPSRKLSRGVFRFLHHVCATELRDYDKSRSLNKGTKQNARFGPERDGSEILKKPSEEGFFVLLLF